MSGTGDDWTVAVAFDRTAHHTRAHAVLRTTDGAEYSGIGLAHSTLEGHGLAHVAGYLAAGRALSDLTQELLEAVATDVEAALSGVIAAAPSSPAGLHRRGATRA